MSQIGFVWVWLRLWERTDGSMQRVKKWRAVARVLVLLLLCGFMTVSAVTRLEEPVFTQVYYAQNNDRQEHVVYFTSFIMLKISGASLSVLFSRGTGYSFVSYNR